MINIQCPCCAEKISNKWILTGEYGVIYKCNNCGVILKWNFLRMVINIIGYSLGIFFIITTKAKWGVDSQIIKVIISTIIIICIPKIIILVLPNFLLKRMFLREYECKK